MSDLLLLNQLPFTVRDGSATKGAPEEIGGANVRSYGGSLMSSRRALKRSYTAESPLMSEADALAWQSLLMGEGHHFSFDSGLYSSKGLGPDAGYTASQNTSASKFGAGQLSVDDTDGEITYAAQLGSVWTLMFYRFESAAWVHYVITSAGSKWVDGVQDDMATTTWISVSSGSVTITNATGSAVLYDDLVAVPYLFLSAWPALRSAATAAWGATPSLAATGELIKGGSATVRAQLGDTKITQGLLSGAWEQNLHSFPVTLTEV